MLLNLFLYGEVNGNLPHFSPQRCKDNKCGQSGLDRDRSVTARTHLFESMEGKVLGLFNIVSL